MPAASRAIVAATTGDKNNALLFTAEALADLACPESRQCH